MPSWRLRNLLNVRLLAGVLCLTGIGMAAGVGPTGPALQSESQPDEDYEIVRMSKPDGTVVEMRVPRHRSLSAKRPATAKGTLRRLPGTADAGEAPSVTPQIGGHRVARRPQGATPRASSEGPVRRERPSSGRVVTQRANTGTRISHPYTGSRQLTSGVVDLMRPTAVTRGAVSATPVVASDNASEWRTGLGWAPHNEDDDTGRYLSEDDAFAELEPGDGWDGPTDDPDPVGDNSMPGWDAKAIARWDVVPYQTFDEPFHIGVVAFHMNGIDRVDFSVNGGPWVSVEEMQLNPRTDVWEYTAVLIPEYFETDGLVEVRAIVWPEGAGVPRVLAGEMDAGMSTGEHSLVLNANANGTMAALVRYVSPDGDDANSGLSADLPKRTVADAIWAIQQELGTADGGTVYLLSGQHEIAGASWPRSQMTNSHRWLTITAAPGVPPEAVRVRGAATDNRLGSIRLLRWHNVSIDAVTGAEVVGSWASGARVWYDTVEVDGVDRNAATSNGIFGYTSWSGGKYATDSAVRNVQNATNSFALVRGVTIERILSDAFSGSTLVINSTVTDIDREDSGAHPDILQYYGWEPRNIVIYGLSSDPTFDYPNGVQGFFVGGVPTFEDIAIVDSSFFNAPSWSAAFAVNGAVTNLYMFNTTIGGPARWGDSISTYNVVFDTTTWMNGPPPAQEGVTYRPTDPH